MKIEANRIRVLLIEDHGPTAAMLTAMLAGLGFSKVSHAGNVSRAIEMLRESAYDLILCDFQLGIVNGLMLVRMIRRPDGIAQANIPIIMITAHADPERVAEAQGAGVNDFLVKPVVPEKLQRCLMQALEHPRPFVKSKTYVGPDRRRKQTYDHPGRRREDREGRPAPKNIWVVPPKS